jgi:hypothetical protein
LYVKPGMTEARTWSRDGYDPEWLAVRLLRYDWADRSGIMADLAP